MTYLFISLLIKKKYDISSFNISIKLLVKKLTNSVQLKYKLKLQQGHT